MFSLPDCLHFMCFVSLLIFSLSPDGFDVASHFLLRPVDLFSQTIQTDVSLFRFALFPLCLSLLVLVGFVLGHLPPFSILHVLLPPPNSPPALFPSVSVVSPDHIPDELPPVFLFVPVLVPSFSFSKKVICLAFRPHGVALHVRFSR